MGFILWYRNGHSLRFHLNLGFFILLPFINGNESDDGHVLQCGLCVPLPRQLLVCVQVYKVGDDLVDIVHCRVFYPRIVRELHLCTKCFAATGKDVVK